MPPGALSIQLEPGDLFRATLVIAAVILAILFWFRLPDISRTCLLSYSRSSSWSPS